MLPYKVCCAILFLLDLAVSVRESSLFSFVTIGDSGDSGPNVAATAEAITPYANSAFNKFVAMVGDNFYPSGLAYPGDPVFVEKFTRTFSNEGPFHPILGDNDYGGKGHIGSLSAQVAASGLDPRWVMPNLYYRKIFSADNSGKSEIDDGVEQSRVSICAVFIDTQSLADIPNQDQRSLEELEVLSAQIPWIEESLGSLECQTSDFIIVFGHHAIVSGGKKLKKGGNSKVIADLLQPMFAKYTVDMYFSGHEHDLQFAKNRDCLGESFDSFAIHMNSPLPTHCMTYIISGASSKIRAHPVNDAVPGYDHWSVTDTIGFTVSYVAPDAIETVFIASHSNQELNSVISPSHKALRLTKMEALSY